MLKRGKYCFPLNEAVEAIGEKNTVMFPDVNMYFDIHSFECHFTCICYLEVSLHSDLLFMNCQCLTQHQHQDKILVHVSTFGK